MGLSAGQRFGPYLILGPLGAGGMGEVYRARDASLERDVAIKILPAQFANDDDRLARFRREAKALAALNHPNIAVIHSLEESDGVRALVMELCEGPTLAERLSDGAMPLDEAIPVGIQIADALDAAHAAGIVHRDLKPANIKLLGDGTVKVLDFGLAKVEQRGTDSDPAHSPTITAATQAGVVLGTAAYMSPEQARGKTVDKRTDLWAFGCIVYQMLTGCVPFGRDTATETIAAVLEREVDWSKLPANTPSAVHRLLRRTLEKDPRRRLRDAADARLELNDALSGDELPIAAIPRTRGWSALLAGLLVTALVALGFALIRSRPATSDNPAFSRIIRLTSGPDREGGPAISPDTKWVAYVSDAGGTPNVWVKFLAGGEAVNLTAAGTLEISSGFSISGLEISPDGSSIAVAARPRGANGRFATWVLPAPLPGLPHKLLDDSLLGMRWSPDGRQITFMGAGSTSGDALYVADADGGNRRSLIEPKDGMHVHWPAWGADGYIYFLRSFSTLANLATSEIYRIDARGAGAPTPVVRTPRRAQFPAPLPVGKGLIYSADPYTAEMQLRWRSADGTNDQPIAAGVGEYAEGRVSADGTTLVCTLYDLRQSLSRAAAIPGGPALPPLSDGYQGDLDPMFSPAGDRLVFSSSRDGNRHLWTARPDGTDARPLTFGLSQDERPAYSPDGREIAFASDRGGRHAIWVVAADGGPARKILDAELTGGITWARDGRQIIYAAGAGEGPALWKVPLTGGSPSRIPTPSFASEPAMSPTRDVIAFIAVKRTASGAISEIGFVDSNGRASYPNLPNPFAASGFANGMLAWSSDGRRIAVVEQSANNPTRIWLADPEHPKPIARLAELQGARVRGVTWAPDGNAIVYGKHDWTSDIVLMQREPQPD